MASTKVKRSPEMYLVGYYLARRTVLSAEGRPLPPASLGTASWAKAYELFHGALADGRTSRSFGLSLKNVRDTFDAFFDNGRRGWTPEQASPDRLTGLASEVWNAWSGQDDHALEVKIAGLRGAVGRR